MRSPVAEGRWYTLADPVTGETTRARRASSLADGLGTSEALRAWRERTIVAGVMNDVDGASQRWTMAGWGREKDAFIAEAFERGGGFTKARAGTQHHEWAEVDDKTWLHSGDSSELIPQSFWLDFDARRIALTDVGLRPVPEWFERVVYCSSLGVAGRLDLLVVDDDGQVFIADNKTGRATYLAKSCAQLAIYANADWVWNETTQSWQPIPESYVRSDVGYVVNFGVGAGACEIFTLDLLTGWDVAAVAVEAMEMHDRIDGSEINGAVLTSVCSVDLLARYGEDDLTNLQRRAETLVEGGHARLLAELWPFDVLKLGTARQTGHEYGSGEISAISDVIVRVERITEAPFDPPRPKLRVVEPITTPPRPESIDDETRAALIERIEALGRSGGQVKLDRLKRATGIAKIPAVRSTTFDELHGAALARLLDVVERPKTLNDPTCDERSVALEIAAERADVEALARGEGIDQTIPGMTHADAIRASVAKRQETS